MTPLDNQNGTTTHQPTNSRLNASSQPQNSELQIIIIIRCVMFFIVVLFVISCVLVSIAWLIYHPRLPVVTLNSLTVSNFALFKSNLTGSGNMNVTLRNPNKKINIELDNFESSVLYRKTLLSKASMADLYLGKRIEEVSTAEFRFEGEDGISGCEKVLNDSDWKRSINGGVRLQLKMLISMKFVAGNWLSRRDSAWVRCEVQLSPASNGLGIGILLNGGKDCIVDFSI